MYYCHTRYYVPEWCRWLNADSAAMINPYELFGENVYYYCYSDPINYYDPTGHSAILLGIIFGAIIGASIGFGVATYVDYKDDGEVFNGSVKWYDYAGATLAGGVIGGTLGGAIGYAAPVMGSFMGIGGGMSMSTSGVAAMSSSMYMVGAAGLAGSIFLFSKGSGPRIGHNQHENQMFKEAMRQLGVQSKSDPRWERYRRLVENEKRKTGHYYSTLKELIEFLISKF